MEFLKAADGRAPLRERQQTCLRGCSLPEIHERRRGGAKTEKKKTIPPAWNACYVTRSVGGPLFGYTRKTSHVSCTMAASPDLVVGSSFMDHFKWVLVSYFMPESCYDEFFLSFNFLNGKGLSLSTSRIPMSCRGDSNLLRCRFRFKRGRST